MTRTEPIFIGVDVGSSAARAGVFDRTGKLLARNDHSFAINRPAPDHAEHDSGEIWNAVCAAVKAAVSAARIDPTAVRAIAFDATCSLALFDAAGRPASVSETNEDRWNVVMWADHRATGEAQELSATGHRVLDFVGGVISPEMQLPKLLWLKRRDPARWARYGYALDLTDFLTWRATGNLSVSTCTVTCKWTYLAHESPGWQADFLQKAGLGDLAERAGLPERAMPIGSSAGKLTARAASELGLATSCIVGVGLIDAHAGGIGVLGASELSTLNNRIAMIAGTSTCHMAVSREPRKIPGVWGPYFGAMLPGLWLNEAGQSATGALLDFILDWHAAAASLGSDRHSGMTQQVNERVAAQGPQFIETLQVLPDFHGNRSPLADPDARGVIHGLKLDSSLESLARLYYATAIGIALGTRHILDTLNEKGYRVTHLHLTGGHANSPLLVKLYADATGCTVVLPEESDGVLLGTACAAAAASGSFASLNDACAAMIRPGQEVTPDASTRDFFERRYRSFLMMHAHRRALDAEADGAVLQTSRVERTSHVP